LDAGGLNSETTYPYIFKNGTKCSFDPAQVSVGVSGGSVNIT